MVDKIIFKYPLDATFRQEVWMPANAKFLKIQVQRDQLTLWAMHDFPVTDSNLKEYRIFMEVTGRPFEEPVGEYIDTVQVGAYVWHFFQGI